MDVVWGLGIIEHERVFYCRNLVSFLFSNTNTVADYTSSMPSDTIFS